MQKRINELRMQQVEVVLTGSDETISNWAVLNGAKWSSKQKRSK